MNWEAIGAISEMIGALAVVVSLIYLAFQIRQNTNQLEHNERASIAASASAKTSMLITRMPSRAKPRSTSTEARRSRLEVGVAARGEAGTAGI